MEKEKNIELKSPINIKKLFKLVYKYIFTENIFNF